VAVRLLPEQSPGSCKEGEYRWTNRAYFPEELVAIRVYHRDAGDGSFWSTPTAGFLPKLSVSEVQQEIDRKNKKVHRYLRSCSRVWLVICTHAEGLSSIVDIIGETIRGARGIPGPTSYRARSTTAHPASAPTPTMTLLPFPASRVVKRRYED
jgi:hypothetical protein